MNQTFNLQRFLLVLKLEFTEKGKNYLMMAGVLTALLLLCMLPMVMTSQHDQIHIFLHMLGLFAVVIFGCSLYTSQIFNQYGDSPTGISAIMIPASRIEKFLVALLTNLLFIVPFWLLFSYLHYTAVDHANSLAGESGDQYEYLPDEVLLFFFLLHAVIQGSVLLGSIYFSKKSYIKSIASFFIIMLLLSGFYLWLAYHFTSYPSQVVTFPLIGWRVSYNEIGKMHEIAFPAGFQQVVYAFPILLMAGLWVAAFLRLREKQI